MWVLTDTIDVAEGWWLQCLIPKEVFINNNKLLQLKSHDLSGKQKWKIKLNLQASIGFLHLSITNILCYTNFEMT